MEIRTDLPLLETLLDAHSDALGLDLAAYRNHCCRMTNICLALHGDGNSASEKTQIAAAFHDIGIWTHRTFDYLEPSAGLAREYLKQSGRADWADEVSAMITEHHKVTHYQGSSLVEAFRRADLADVSLGMVRFGVPSDFIRSLKMEFPNRGFHKRLVQLAVQRLRTHPLSPMPMMKW